MVELALILGIGTVAMHFIEEDWSLRVAIYWAVETTTTVGYGDIVPTCTAGRVFFIFYAVVSTIIFARVRAPTPLVVAFAPPLETISVRCSRRLRGTSSCSPASTLDRNASWLSWTSSTRASAPPCSKRSRSTIDGTDSSA